MKREKTVDAHTCDCCGAEIDGKARMYIIGADCPNGCDGCPVESDMTDPHTCYKAMARDLIRRAKALAESDANDE